jgi:hypothetical protein
MCKDCALSLASAFWKKKIALRWGRCPTCSLGLFGGDWLRLAVARLVPQLFSFQPAIVQSGSFASSPLLFSHKPKALARAKWQKWERGVFERKTKKLNRGHEFLRLVCSGLQNSKRSEKKVKVDTENFFSHLLELRSGILRVSLSPITSCGANCIVGDTI